MKKSIKPALVFVLLFFTSSVLIILGYVGIKLECEVLVKEKIFAQERLDTGLNTRIQYTAKYELLNGPERIVNIAQKELGMIKDSSVNMQITVQQSEIKRISELLTEKYDQ